MLLLFCNLNEMQIAMRLATRSNEWRLRDLQADKYGVCVIFIKY